MIFCLSDNSSLTYISTYVYNAKIFFSQVALILRMTFGSYLTESNVRTYKNSCVMVRPKLKITQEIIKRNLMLKESVPTFFNGLISFLLYGETTETWKVYVSMPFNELIPFLPTGRLWMAKIASKCVNALQRAYTISTHHYPNGDILDSVCQCPLTGLYHFYR